VATVVGDVAVSAVKDSTNERLRMTNHQTQKTRIATPTPRVIFVLFSIAMCVVLYFSR
jgi:hypothetical protein